MLNLLFVSEANLSVPIPILNRSNTLMDMAALSVDRKLSAQSQYFGFDLLDHRLVLAVVQHVAHPASDPARFVTAHATSRHCWRANTNPAGDEGRLRIVRDRVFVDREMRGA